MPALKTLLLMKHDDSVACTHAAGTVAAARVSPVVQVRQLTGVTSEQDKQDESHKIGKQELGGTEAL